MPRWRSQSCRIIGIITTRETGGYDLCGVKNQLVYEYEKVEDLGLKGYKVIQNKDGFCFGSDAVLLARFAAPKKGARVLDMCTGTGIIPVLLWGLNDLEAEEVIEIVPEVADMAKRTMLLNGLEDKIRVTCGDLKSCAEIYGRHAFDAVTCNPPYMNFGGGLVNPKDKLAVARHEIACTLDDVVKMSRAVLKPCGKLFMVHRADRMCDVVSTFRKYGIEPKRLQIVYPSAEKAASLILIEGAEGGKPFLKLEKPLFMYDSDGNYIQSLK